MRFSTVFAASTLALSGFAVAQRGFEDNLHARSAYADALAELETRAFEEGDLGLYIRSRLSARDVQAPIDHSTGSEKQLSVNTPSPYGKPSIPSTGYSDKSASQPPQKAGDLGMKRKNEQAPEEGRDKKKKKQEVNPSDEDRLRRPKKHHDGQRGPKDVRKSKKKHDRKLEKERKRLGKMEKQKNKQEKLVEEEMEAYVTEDEEYRKEMKQLKKTEKEKNMLEKEVEGDMEEYVAEDEDYKDEMKKYNKEKHRHHKHKGTSDHGNRGSDDDGSKSRLYARDWF